MLLGLIGMPGSGKGESARIARELGMTVVNMGDLVREYTKQLNLELTDDNVGSVAHTEREKFGYGIWAERTNEKIKALDLNSNDFVIIDGIRGDAEVSVFQEVFTDEFKTIAIKMPAKRRFELLKNRNRTDAPITWEEFNKRDEREAKWGIKNALEQADYILINNGTLNDLEESFKELLEVIKYQIK
jgi:dephospho-CoA kinase